MHHLSQLNFSAYPQPSQWLSFGSTVCCVQYDPTVYYSSSLPIIGLTRAKGYAFLYNLKHQWNAFAYLSPITIFSWRINHFYAAKT